MSKLTNEDVLKLARLSRIRLTNEELEKFKAQLGEILDYVEQLDGIDTENLEPTYQVTGLKNVTRKDEVKDYGYQTKDLVELNSPKAQDGQFKVKRVL